MFHLINYFSLSGTSDFIQYHYQLIILLSIDVNDDCILDRFLSIQENIFDEY